MAYKMTGCIQRTKQAIIDQHSFTKNLKNIKKSEKEIRKTSHNELPLTNFNYTKKLIGWFMRLNLRVKIWVKKEVNVVSGCWI